MQALRDNFPFGVVFLCPLDPEKLGWSEPERNRRSVGPQLVARSLSERRPHKTPHLCFGTV